MKMSTFIVGIFLPSYTCTDMHKKITLVDYDFDLHASSIKKIVVKNNVNRFLCFVIFGTIITRKFRW